MFRLDSFVLPGRPLGVRVRPLQALVPMGLSLLAFDTPGLLCCPTQRKRRRLEHLHDLCGNKALQERPSQTEAARDSVLNSRPQTGVAHVMRLAALGSQQSPPAPPTDEQAHQEGGAFARRTEGVSHGTVGG